MIRITRLFALLIALAFVVPACGFSSPTASDDAFLPPMAAFGLDEGEDEDCEEDENGEVVCGLGGFLGSGS